MNKPINHCLDIITSNYQPTNTSNTLLIYTINMNPNREKMGTRVNRYSS